MPKSAGRTVTFSSGPLYQMDHFQHQFHAHLFQLEVMFRGNIRQSKNRTAEIFLAQKLRHQDWLFFSNLVLKMPTSSDDNSNRRGSSSNISSPSPSQHDSETTAFYSDRMRSLRTFLSILLSEGIGFDFLVESKAFRNFLGFDSGIILTHLQKQ